MSPLRLFCLLLRFFERLLFPLLPYSYFFSYFSRLLSLRLRAQLFSVLLAQYAGLAEGLLTLFSLLTGACCRY
jgi:hypothetical protein